MLLGISMLKYGLKSGGNGTCADNRGVFFNSNATMGK